MARLFVAVWPSEDVVEELRSLRRKDQRGVRFVEPESWHVTLRFLGEADPDEATAALDQAALPTAHATFGPAVDVVGERALVVPVSGLDDLASAVRDATAHLGEPPPRRRFVGHLTLARVKPHAAMPEALGAMVRAEMPVQEVALVRSRLAPDRARYDTVATWPVG
jgi:RNA 2',3'-cyclic 3'-phosphodiesterase